MYLRWIWVIVIVAIAGCHSDSIEPSKASTQSTPQLDKVFQLLPSDKTQVKFVNKLDSDPTGYRNVLSYHHYYNGAGVAISDFNNDGWNDIFLAGNEVENKLYINKEGLTFEDVTAQSGLNKGKNWSGGVSIVDINNDGYQDIYVCQQGPYKDNKDLQNLLYLNNGNLTFTEVGRAFGLNDDNQSTQAVFFDYDRDNDLDCYVLNESPYVAKPLQTIIDALKVKANLERSSGNLYRNDGSKFVKVTEEAGVLKHGFGLGVAVSDINNDGWPDLYVANDYSVPDFMYINQKDGTFKESIKDHTKQISFYGMGCDIADFNNDGNVDICVVDMAANDHFRSKTLMANMDVSKLRYLTENLDYQQQYMFNSLQLNNGNGSFSNIASFCNFEKSDWSWASIFSDVDLDGDKDIFVANGFRRYGRDNDSRLRMEKIRKENGGNVPVKYRKEIYANIPVVKLPNRLYINNGELSFDEQAEKLGLPQETFSYGAAFGDLDNDGDMELVVNNIDQEAMIYENLSAGSHDFVRVKLNSEKTLPIGSKLTLKTSNGDQFQEYYFVRGYESTMEQVVTFGLGKGTEIKSLEIIWPDGNQQIVNNVTKNQLNVIDYAAGSQYQYVNKQQKQQLLASLSSDVTGVNYKHRENRFDDFAKEILLPHMQSTLGPALAQADVNNDGLEDFYVGGAKGTRPQLYLQKANGQFAAHSADSWATDVMSEDMDAVFFDANGDGNKDLLVLSGGGGDFESDKKMLLDRFYANMGNGQFARVQNVIPELYMNSSCLALDDFDGDGDQDLFIGAGSKPGQYPAAEQSRLLIWDNNRFNDVTESYLPNNGELGLIKSAEWVDLNGDNKKDLVLAGEWTNIKVFIQSDNKLVDQSTKYNTSELHGWWYNLALEDLDNDGDMDIVAGNLGTNYKHKVSPKKPLYLYYNDFDENGVGDVVLCKEYKGELVPARGRQCSSDQMPFIKEKFPTYTEFANANIIDIYGKDKIEKSHKLKATHFNSMILENVGGKFEPRTLPPQANLFPILDSEIIDINGDGHLDIIATGNIYNTELETPRMDAGNGLVMLGDGQLNFKALSTSESGFNTPFNAKKMKKVKGANKNYLVVANNNEKVQMFTW